MPIFSYMEEDQEVVREFLVESNESLARFRPDTVELESGSLDAELLASVFRTIYTRKGACGFLRFTTLETISHRAENLLWLDPGLASLILETVDATRKALSSIEAASREGEEAFESLEVRFAGGCRGNGWVDGDCGGIGRG